jgi:hypothetical protein
MTVASYTEDLTDIATGDEASGWTVFSTNQQGTPSYQDADYPYIQGNYAVTQTCSKSKTIANLGYDYGSDTNPGTDDAIFVWQYFASAFAMDDYAGTTTGQAGMCILIGNSTSNFDIWEVGGKDKTPYPYGGFICHAVCPSVTADDVTNGPRTSEQVIGAQINLTAYPSKGEPHSVDVMRFGRGSAIFEYGDGTGSPPNYNYATIAGFAAQNDLQANRWGLIQEVAGGYLWQGRMSLGTASNAVDFRDDGQIIFIKWNPKVTSNFNTIEVINASSNIVMTNFQFIQLDTTTASRGRWITTNNAPVDISNTSFQDMGTFAFDSNTTATAVIFRRCLQVDPNAADLSFASILESDVTGGGSAGGGALLWNDSGDPNTKINDMIFTKGAGSHHAIEFGTSAPTTINLTNMTFTDFNVSNQQTDSVLYFPDKGTDTTWTVQHTGTTGTISYYKARSGDTVNISSSVTMTVTVKNDSGNAIEGVRVRIENASTGALISNGSTNSSGIYTDNYTGSTPLNVKVIARLKGYIWYPIFAQITGTGLEVSFTLSRDKAVNLP